eukprot:gene8592-34034_t
MGTSERQRQLAWRGGYAGPSRGTPGARGRLEEAGADVAPQGSSPPEDGGEDRVVPAPGGQYYSTGHARGAMSQHHQAMAYHPVSAPAPASAPGGGLAHHPRVKTKTEPTQYTRPSSMGDRHNPGTVKAGPPNTRPPTQAPYHQALQPAGMGLAPPFLGVKAISDGACKGLFQATYPFPQPARGPSHPPILQPQVIGIFVSALQAARACDMVCLAVSENGYGKHNRDTLNFAAEIVARGELNAIAAGGSKDMPASATMNALSKTWLMAKDGALQPSLASAMQCAFPGRIHNSGLR